MAYVLWRVFMKKYSKVRLGIRNLPSVIPADRRLPEKEETWSITTDPQDGEEAGDSKLKGLEKEAVESNKVYSRLPEVCSTAEDAGDIDNTLPRSQETRKSKTKKVKSYLRKCKGALSKNDECSTDKKRQENCTSWYLDDPQTTSGRSSEDNDGVFEKYTEVAEEKCVSDEIQDSMCTTVDDSKQEISENVSEEALARLSREGQSVDTGRNRKTPAYDDCELLCTEQCESTEKSHPPKESEDLYGRKKNDAISLETLTTEDTTLNKCDSNDTLIAEIAEVTECVTVDAEAELFSSTLEETPEDAAEESEEGIGNEPTPPTRSLSMGRGDVASLVRNLLGPIYGNGVINLLIRQARDILVCGYHGNLDNFVKSYLSPAATLLAEVKCIASETGNESVVPEGWPLTLGSCGLVLQLGELEASALRLGEFYLCIRSSAVATGNNSTASGCEAGTVECVERNTVERNTVERNTVQRNTVEIAVVWRATSMRAPGILGWDREEELTDWRELSQKDSGAASGRASGRTSGRISGRISGRTSGKTNGRTNGKGLVVAAAAAQQFPAEKVVSRARRRSREEARSRNRERSAESTERRREEVRSIDRLEQREQWEQRREEREDGERNSTASTVMKSRSASSVDTWKVDLDEELARTYGRTNSKNSSLSGDEGRAKVKRCAKVVSSSTMEKWKETARCETRSKVLAPDDLKTSLRLEEAVVTVVTRQHHGVISRSEQRDRVAEDRLQTRHPDEVTDDELATFISNLLVTVERKIERVSLDDLTFPCPACRNIDTDDPLLGCSCAGDDCSCEGGEGGEDSCGDCPSSNLSSGKEETRSFEVAGIKHIDSDDEEEVRMGFGSRKRIDEIIPPRTIHDVPEHVLTCGLTFPGYLDTEGRPVLLFEDSGFNRDNLSARNISSFLLYLARLPSSDSRKSGFTFLIRNESADCLELIDGALALVQGRINVAQVLILRSTAAEDQNDSLLRLSRVKTTVVNDETLNAYVPRREGNHNQAQWIIFYKEYDGLMTEWQAAGRRLALEMSELKECTSLAGTLTPLGRLLTDPTLRRTSRDAEEVIAALEERAAPLAHIDHVRLSIERARRLVEEVGNAASRLESSFESRRATIRNLAVLRSIEDQAHEVLSWLCKKGEDVLSKHAQHAATSLTAARLHEREFEKFYFTSMRHLDKGSDLAEAASASGLRELARSLKQHLRGFGSRLEDRREYLEDTSRCCLLQDRAYEWAQEARIAGERRAQQFLMARPPLPPEHFTEMMALAEKLGNEILLEQCRIARNKCAEALELARTSSAPGSPARRRSFAASESATSWDDALAKRTSWDDSDSSASYACPMESVGSAGSGGRSVLDNIAELRESAEQLLDCSPPHTPPRSPAPRRLVKPPVNSHLHRSASIAPGMKAKKTILLIMREMIQTERDYVKSLEYIIENYIPELVREDIPQALRGQRNVIFGNVEKIYEFHSQHFLRELEQCEQSPMLVGQCFLRHEKKFYLYALYNKNKPNSDSLMAEYGTTFFKQKQLELGDKMDLASYLLKPVQRMGKYALLLQQLVKAGADLSEQSSGKEDKDEKDDGIKPMVEGEADLRAAEQMVRFQLRHGNDLLAMDSLRDCDVNVKEQGRLLRQNEFLVWQGKGKKCLRQVFLFEDLILFSKARRFPDRKNLDIYIYKHSIKTTDIGLTAVIADSPTKFEIWFRKRKPGDTYTLQCASEDIKKAWTEELSNLLWKQALRNREVRLAEMSSMGIGNKPCLDIRPSADQINDRSISVAQLSKTPRFRNSIAVSMSDDSSRCSRRPHSVISVSSSSSSGGSSGPPTTLNLGLDTSPRPHHRSTTLNSQCSVESGIIADISIVSDDGGDGTERSHWSSTLESPTSHLPTTSTPLQSPTSATAATVTSANSTDTNNLTPYDQDMSINL